MLSYVCMFGGGGTGHSGCVRGGEVMQTSGGKGGPDSGTSQGAQGHDGLQRKEERMERKRREAEGQGQGQGWVAWGGALWGWVGWKAQPG